MTEIRVATHRDIENIVELVEQFWNEHEHSEYGDFDAPSTRMTLHGLVDGPMSILLAAEDSGSIVGYIAFIVAKIPWGNVSSAVESLWWVLPEYRDRGIGTDLLSAGLEWAEIMGCDVLEAHEGGTRMYKPCHGQSSLERLSAGASAS